MKSLWDFFDEGYGESKLFHPEEFSPYLEHGGTCLNSDRYIEQAMQPVNCLFRHEEILGPLLDDDRWHGYEKERRIVLDVLIHYLTWTDMKYGITKKDIFMDFLVQELEQGTYGTEAKKLLGILDREQKRKICYYMLQQTFTGSSLTFFQKVLQSLFEHATVYKRKGVYKSILIYIGEEPKEELQEIVNGIVILFLPIGYHIRFFWKKHFGVIGSAETMHLGGIEIF